MSSGRGSAKKKQRMRLHPFCFWCERPVFLYSDGKHHDDQATLDHIYQKIWYPHGRPSEAKVLSCHACNNERAVIADRIIKEIRELADIDLGRRRAYPCPECARPIARRPGSFCGRECWEMNRARISPA